MKSRSAKVLKFMRWFAIAMIIVCLVIDLVAYLRFGRLTCYLSAAVGFNLSTLFWQFKLERFIKDEDKLFDILVQQQRLISQLYRHLPIDEEWARNRMNQVDSSRN